METKLQENEEIMERFEFKISRWYLFALIHSDYTGYSKPEEERLKKWIDYTTGQLDGLWEFPVDSAESTEYVKCCISGLMTNCVEVIFNMTQPTAPKKGVN